MLLNLVVVFKNCHLCARYQVRQLFKRWIIKFSSSTVQFSILYLSMNNQDPEKLCKQSKTKARKDKIFCHFFIKVSPSQDDWLFKHLLQLIVLCLLHPQRPETSNSQASLWLGLGQLVDTVLSNDVWAEFPRETFFCPPPPVSKVSLPFALCSGKEDSLSRHSVLTLDNEKGRCRKSSSLMSSLTTYTSPRLPDVRILVTQEK